MKTLLITYSVLEGLLLILFGLFWLTGLSTWAFVALWCMLPLLIVLGGILLFQTFKSNERSVQ